MTDAVAGPCCNITQAAELLGVSRVTVWRWIRAGRLPATRLGHRTVRIDREALLRLGATDLSLAAGTHSRLLPTGSVATGEPDTLQDWRTTSDKEHVVLFYETEAFLLDMVASFIGEAFRVGDIGVVVATTSHREHLEQRWTAMGFDHYRLREQGSYRPCDAAEVLSDLVIDGMPDPQRFATFGRRILPEPSPTSGQVRVFGEMVDLLVHDDNQAGALALEDLWNQLLLKQPFRLLCAYSMPDLGGRHRAKLLDEICDRHTRVIAAESYSAASAQDNRARVVANLQQRAQTLEAEIAERDRIEQRLRDALAAERAARDQAEAALRARDDFLSIAAHELKTPIAGLSGFAQLALRRLKRHGHIDPDLISSALESVSGQASKLTRLINHLLDVSRFDAGKLQLELEISDLASFVVQVVAELQTQVGERDLRVQAPNSLYANVDPFRLEQVLTNLVDNAIKYSPENRPIDITLKAVDDGRAELAVRDRGLGIPLEKRSHIFERFYQAHDDGHRSGIGLGLFISRQIVELHGGHIRAEFPPDGGSHFVVTLPLRSEAGNPPIDFALERQSKS